MLLFLAPAGAMLIGEGTAKGAAYAPKGISRLVLLVLAAVLFLLPVFLAVPSALRGYRHQEIGPVMDYLSEYMPAGDVLYVYYAATPALRYYCEVYGHDLWGLDQRDAFAARPQQVRCEAENAHEQRGPT